MGLYELEQPGDRVQHGHLHRYLFARRYCTGRRVVDVACGEGHGAHLLGQVAAEVIGVDSSVDTIEHASTTYGSQCVVFHVADAASIPVEDGHADVVVSFETIQQLDDRPAFLAEVVRILRPGGLLILSTADDLERSELTALLEQRFARVVVGGQRSDPGSSIFFPAAAEAPAAASFFDRAEGGRFVGSAELPAPASLIAVATNGALPELGPSTLLDSGYLPQLRAAYDEALADARAEVAARDRRLERLEHSIGKTREALLAGQGEQPVLSSSMAELEADVASLSLTIEALRSELAQARSELDEAHTSVLRRLVAPVHAGAVGSVTRAWTRAVRSLPRPRRRRRSRVARTQVPAGLLPATTPSRTGSGDEAGLPSEIRDDAIVARASAWADSVSPRRLAERLEYRPLVSVLMPTFDTPPELLHAAVRSVLAQSYAEWELVIADDGSTAPGFALELERIATWDPRIRVTRRSANGGIAEATNMALQHATGEFVAMLDHDDELHPDALFEVVRALNAEPTLDAVYTDQESIDADGNPGEPLLKPDWSPTLFCGVMYVGHLLTVRRELALAAGGFDSRFDNVQDFDLMLRLSERTDRIAHVPRVLYRWRRVPGSVAFHADEKAGIEELQAAAVSAHLERVGVRARARPHPRHAHRAELVPLDGDARTVTLVVVIPAGEELDSATLDELVRRAGTSIERIVPRGAGSSLRDVKDLVSSDFVLVLENGVVPESDAWVASLVLHAELEDVAAVSPVVLGSAGPWVEDAGLILGLDGGLGVAMSGWDSSDDGYAGSLSCAREVSAVSGTCALIEIATLERLGGFSELYAEPGLAWVDLSLRARAAGLRNVVTPRAMVRRAGDVTGTAREPDPLDRWLLRDTWAAAIAGIDPYHNPQFEPVPGGYGR